MKQSGYITVIATITPLVEYAETVFEAAKHICSETNKEDGCQSFNLHTDQSGEKIIFYEVFESEKDFDIHRKAAHTEKFLFFLRGKVENDGPEIIFLNQYIN